MSAPSPIARVLEGWIEVESIRSSPETTSVFERGDRRRVWKEGPGVPAEATILRWLQDRVPVPVMVAAADRHLVTECATGIAANDPQWSTRADEIAALLGRGLRRWHDTPSAGCPVDRSPWALLSFARHRIEEDQIDSSSLARRHPGRTPEQILRRLEQTIPDRFVPTLIHGDFSLSNVIVDGADLCFEGVARAGVGDRHLDLSVAASSLASTWGDAWVPTLFEHYGQFPDPDRITWYRLLHELL